MTLAESKGGRPRRSFASCARCATWQPPECDQYDPDVSSSLRPYLDLDHDPPAALILTDDVRSIAEPSLAERSPEPMPPWSRLDQRPPQDGSLPVAAPAAALAGEICGKLSPMLPEAMHEDDANNQEQVEQKRQHTREVMMQVFAWLEDDYAGTTCGRSRKAAYTEGLNARKKMQLKAALQMQPRLKHWQRRRGNEVPTAARNAVVSVLQNLFASYHFEPREVRIEVARPLQTGHGESFRFPRLEASIYGRWSPMSLCCNTAVLTFFDVVCGVCAICLKSTCAAPALELMPLSEALRMEIWGHWIALNGGVLPKHRPPRPARTRFFPTGQDGAWAPRTSAMALLAEQEDQRQLVRLDVELRHAELGLESERSIGGSEPCEEAEDSLLEAIEAVPASMEGSLAAFAAEACVSSGLEDPNIDALVSGRSVSPRPVLRRPPSNKDAWRTRPVTDGQAALLKSKLEELYLEQRFGFGLLDMDFRADKLLQGAHQGQGVAAATQSEDLFYLTAEEGAPVPDERHRPATAQSSNSAATRSSLAMSRPTSSRPRSANPGRNSQLRGDRQRMMQTGKAASPPQAVSRASFARLGQRWRVLPPKHVRPHQSNLPSLLMVASSNVR